MHRHLRISPLRPKPLGVSSGFYDPRKPSPLPRPLLNPATTPSLVRFKSASEESLLDPRVRYHNHHHDERTTTNENGGGAEPETPTEEKSFVRKVASSFRFGRKKSPGSGTELTISSPVSSEGSKSVPQSPLLPRTPLSASRLGAVFVLPSIPVDVDCESLKRSSFLGTLNF